MDVNNSLSHFTSEFSNLLGILDKGLKYSYLEEDLPLDDTGFSLYSFPGVIRFHKDSNVICFCDIPFSDIGEHTDQYGKYAIGLDRKYCMGKGISPIRYFHIDTLDLKEKGLLDALAFIRHCHDYKLSPFGMTVNELIFEKQINKFDPDDFDKLSKEAKLIIERLSMKCLNYSSFLTLQLDFLRAYEGNWTDRVTKENTNRIFYNEREWRLPQINPKDIYFKFDYEYITYLIVTTEDEKKKLLELKIEGIKDKIYLLSELR